MIRLLPETLVNRIAAGEVIERPAAVVKELAENAVDAGARHVEVALEDGGRVRISVVDDGRGMTADELLLAVERHATSKLPDEDLVNIRTLGFRGEALPSIGAVARLHIASRAEGAPDAFAIGVEAGRKGRPVPAALRAGTRIEVRDLFYATPARLKFLKAARTEFDYAAGALRRLAMAHPGVAFSLSDGARERFRYPRADGDGARLGRLSAAMGREFADNAVPVEAERGGARLSGYAGLPTLNRGNGRAQFLFVNGRPVQDRLLIGAVRGAYQDFLARDRHPMVALFLDVPPEAVDVNVHPAKTEVRFRDASLARGLIVGGLRRALETAGHRASTTVATTAFDAFRPGGGRRPESLPVRESPAPFAEALLGLDRPSARPAPRRGSAAARRAAGRRARPAPRKLHRRPDGIRNRHRRPACGARAAGLRAHEGAARERQRGTAGAPRSGGRGRWRKPLSTWSAAARRNFGNSGSSSRGSAPAR